MLHYICPCYKTWLIWSLIAENAVICFKKYIYKSRNIDWADREDILLHSAQKKKTLYKYNNYIILLLLIILVSLPFNNH